MTHRELFYFSESAACSYKKKMRYAEMKMMLSFVEICRNDDDVVFVS